MAGMAQSLHHTRPIWHAVARNANIKQSSIVAWRGLHASPALRQQGSDQDLIAQIKDQLKQAMRSKDSFASTVYKSLLSEQQYAAKSAEASGSAVVQMASILQKALAKRQDSSRQFRAASRDDLADKEDREAQLIQTFLPEQIKPEELDKIVQAAIEEVKSAAQGAGEGKRLMGEVMKRVTSQVDRSRAPGALISETVKKWLA